METAVELFAQRLIQRGIGYNNMDFEEAKEMFEKQIKDAYLNGRYDADKIVMTERFYSEQYYNKTFKQQEQ